MKVVKKIVKAVGASTATVIMVGVAPTFAMVHTGWRIASIVLPRRYFHYGEDFLWGSYQKVILFFFEHMTGVEILISGNVPNEKENNILICNHQCTMDWIVADMLAARQNMVGNMRYVFKNAIKYMPLYGYVFGVHGGVFVKRDGSYNEKNMKKVLCYLMKQKVDMNLVIFPEGTRYSTKRKELLSKSQAYAIENDLPPLTQVLTPRVKAFQCALTTMRDYVTAVYDATILYEMQTNLSSGCRPAAPSMWRFLMNEKPRILIQFHRIPVTEVTFNTQKSTLQWLHNRFVQKDSFISQHYGFPEDKNSGEVTAGVLTPTKYDKQDVVFTKEKCPNFSILQTLPPTVALTAVTAALILHPTGRKAYFFSLLGGSILGMAYAKVFM
uniref:1-acyl-sn-glycerol-3-phosphate acyltransferase epsilon-like n=1 Tax=Ciona intestinalis TaxID=7719 RepID=F7A726_CIOIN|nr:1-acyl-sn-glycerol-3-phosphate acyltransferase epsilon-like [Ciona intestinalis]|eukprot:XP_002120484.1 1-acyl-sn-glycerol-3-phosphate acyltransferase epsilon-like [Ciona intestinalis]